MNLKAILKMLYEFVSQSYHAGEGGAEERVGEGGRGVVER